MGEPGGHPDGSDATSRTHHAQSMLHCETAVLAPLHIVNVDVIRCFTLIICFRRINRMVVKSHLH